MSGKKKLQKKILITIIKKSRWIR